MNSNDYVKFYDSFHRKRYINHYNYNNGEIINQYLLNNNDVFICVENYNGVISLRSVLSGIEDENIYFVSFFDTSYFNVLSDNEINDVKIKLRKYKIEKIIKQING